MPVAGEAVVLVEPLYASVAAALALDAGWGSVELAQLDAGAAPIPLVSFEQAPPSAHRGGRCRVRTHLGELRSAHAALGAPELALLGSAAVARPLCARLAYSAFDTITFVPVGSSGALSSDGWWASGMLIRVLLDELDERIPVLDDAAGIAVALADASSDLSGALLGSARWRAHAAAGGSEDDVRLATAVDSVGTVPRVDTVADDSIVLVPWL